MRFLSLSLGREQVDFEEAWQCQREIHADVVAGSRPNTVLLVEHTAVYTAGKRTASWDRPTDGSRVVDVDRGGKITWHGPGQLVVYPIIRLPEPADVIRYVRSLEDAIMATATDLGVVTKRVAGRSGVWVSGDELSSPPWQDRKLAAIGVRVSRGVTMHGLAINVSCDLSAFSAIVPCGISDASVTSITAETGNETTVTQVAQVVRPHLQEHLAYAEKSIDDSGQDVALTSDLAYAVAEERIVR